MNRWSANAAWMAIVAMSLMACGKTDSNLLKVDQIKAVVEISAGEDNTAKVRVVLTELNNSLKYVNLSGSDKLYVTAGSQPRQTMTKDDGLNIINYDATFSGLGAANTNFKIEFVRGDGFKGAADTNCTLPAGFTISSPIEDTPFSRATNDVPFSVTAGNNSYVMKLSGSCITSVERSVTDAADGAFTIARNEIIATGDNASASCDVTTTLLRQAQGSMDTAWGGGSILCTQSRSRDFRSTP